MDLLTSRPRLREFGDDPSVETRQSVVLRVVCGVVTALLSGYLNVPAENLLLVAHTGVGA